MTGSCFLTLYFHCVCACRMRTQRLFHRFDFIKTLTQNLIRFKTIKQSFRDTNMGPIKTNSPLPKVMLQLRRTLSRFRTDKHVRHVCEEWTVVQSWQRCSCSALICHNKSMSSTIFDVKHYCTTLVQGLKGWKATLACVLVLFIAFAVSLCVKLWFFGKKVKYKLGLIKATANSTVETLMLWMR